MSSINEHKILNEAKEYFMQSDYKRALEKFAAVLQRYPNSKEAYNGVILSEMALSGEGGAEALFDYYEILKIEDEERADEIMSEILSSMDGTLDALSEMLMEPLKHRLESEDGILFEDLIKILEASGEDFKDVFDNVMFSTKIIITKKEDLLKFLGLLIENGYEEMALSYLENAIGLYPTDQTLRALFERLSKRLVLED